MTRRDEQEGLSEIGARLLGFDAMCRCGHEKGLHNKWECCVVIDCKCTGFISTFGEEGPTK